MQKMSIAVIFFLSLMLSTTMAAAEQESETELHEELGMDEKLQLLTDIALEYEIPPEILKAIALKESKIMQFDNGQPLITGDGGIGMMQVTTPGADVDMEKLKYDTAYNIEVGAKILKEKWELQYKGRIPMINDGNPRILENWYFAVMAYNGLAQSNDPNHNEAPYQEKVYEELEKYSQIDVAEFPAISIDYNEKGTMIFPEKQLHWEDAATESTQMFINGDSVYVMNSLDPKIYHYGNLRTEPSITSGKSRKLPYYTELKITGGPYIGSASLFNHFVMYEVKGSDFTGYIASSNLRKKSSNEVFKIWGEKQTEDVQKSWTIQLSQSVNPGTVNPKNVYIVDESGDGIFTKLTYHEDSQTISVVPETPFEKGVQYALIIKDLYSLTGKPLKENISMSFSVGA